MSSSIPSLEKNIPENFEKIIHDFTADLSTTFPEHQHLWQKWSVTSSSTYTPELWNTELKTLYQYCLSFYPEKFFDILYNNEDIFKEDSNKTTLFLPDVDFKLLFNCENISAKTRKIMWNYLQLILMTVIGSIDSKDGFGNSTKKMFEGIDEKDLFEKLNETMESMSNFFQSMSEGETPGASDSNNTAPDDAAEESGGDDDVEDDDESDPTSFFKKMKGMPNIKDIYGHLKTLFEGKIGSLAKELTEEIAHDMENLFGEESGEGAPTSTKDIIQNLLKNPEKMTGLIKTVSEKLNNKISTGEISQDELLKEATEIMNKMKGMGDSKQFQDMFKNISKMSGLGGQGAKFDMNAFQQKSNLSSTRDKLKEKMLKKRTAQVESALAAAAAAPPVPECRLSEESPNNFKFSIGGGVGENEVTPIAAPSSSKSKNPKKKKGKGKK